MVKSRASKVRKTSKSAAVTTRKSVDMVYVGEKVRNLIGNTAEDMTAKMIEEVETNHSIAAMKFLFELVGLAPGGVAEPEEPRDSLAKILLDELGVPEDIRQRAAEMAAGNIVE